MSPVLIRVCCGSTRSLILLALTRGLLVALRISTPNQQMSPACCCTAALTHWLSSLCSACCVSDAGNWIRFRPTSHQWGHAVFSRLQAAQWKRQGERLSLDLVLSRGPWEEPLSYSCCCRSISAAGFLPASSPIFSFVWVWCWRTATSGCSRSRTRSRFPSRSLG